MSKKKTKNEEAKTEAKSLDRGVRKIEPNENVIDDLQCMLLDVCNDWINDHDLASCFYIATPDYQEGKDNEPVSLLAHLTKQIEYLRERLDARMQDGGFYALEGGHE